MKIYLLLLITTLLAGCAGGGGDSDTTPAVFPRVTAVVIDQDPDTGCVTGSNADGEIQYHAGSVPLINLQWQCTNDAGGATMEHLERALMYVDGLQCYIPVPEPTTPSVARTEHPACLDSLPVLNTPDYRIGIETTKAIGYTYPDGMGLGLTTTVANTGNVQAFNLRVRYELSAVGYTHETILVRDLKWVAAGETASTVPMRFFSSGIMGKTVTVTTLLSDLSNDVVATHVTQVYVPPLQLPIDG